MNQAQFNLITAQRFPRLSPQTVDACRAVIIDGATSYAAEQAFKCSKGTVNRYVLKINAELSFCEEVAGNTTAAGPAQVQPQNDRLQRHRIVDASGTGRGKRVVAENIRSVVTATVMANALNAVGCLYEQ